MTSRLLICAAVASLFAGNAMAQSTTPTAPSATVPAQPEVEMVVRASGHLASNLIGETVYSGAGADAENIGKITDLVITDEADVEAIVVGVGGFLGIGRKEVALQYDLATWAERDGDRWLVIETNADALKALDDFDRSAYQPMPVDAEVAEPKPATAEEIKAAEEKVEAEAEQAEAEAQSAEPAGQ